MKSHATDKLSLGFGFAFLAVAGFWLASELVEVSRVVLGATVAFGLMVIGVLGIAAVLSRRDDRQSSG